MEREKSLYSELKRIGIDDELAAKVSASLDPDYNASKKDVLVMQEAMMQLQARTDERNNQFVEKLAQVQVESDKRYHQVQAESDKRNIQITERLAQVQAESDKRNSQITERLAQVQAESDKRYYEIKMEIVESNAQLRAEMHGINRHFLATIYGMVVTIASVLAINWYFHQ